MRKEWLGVALASLVLAACTTPEPQNTAPPQPAYNGPVVEIPGVEPRYEPVNPGTSQDYSVNGKNYRIIPQELKFYRQVRLAVPRNCPDCRHNHRFSLRSPRKLYARTCAKCSAPIQTSYAPERPEKVYCEKCYLETVY